MSQCPHFKRFIRSLPKEERDKRKRELNYIRNYGKKSGIGSICALKNYTYIEILELEANNMQKYGVKIPDGSQVPWYDDPKRMNQQTYIDGIPLIEYLRREQNI